MAAMPYIIALKVIYLGYYFFLISAFEHSDLSLIRLIAKGAALAWSTLDATNLPGILSNTALAWIIGVLCSIVILVDLELGILLKGLFHAFAQLDGEDNSQNI